MGLRRPRSWRHRRRPPPSRQAPRTTAAAAVSGPDGYPPRAPALEAGIGPWQLATPLSREACRCWERLRILGGLAHTGDSLNTVSWLDPASGTVTAAGSPAAVVHDGAGAEIGAPSVVFGGGSPDTFATVQSLGPAAGRRSGRPLPQPRSDLATTTVGHTVYIVGGYDGTTYDPSVLDHDGRDPLHERGEPTVPVATPPRRALMNCSCFDGRAAAAPAAQ